MCKGMFRWALFIALGATTMIGCGGGEDAMEGDEVKPDAPSLKSELETIYTTVRQAFIEYDLDRARPYLNLPEGTPTPTRAQAQGMGEFLPDLAAARFIKLTEKPAQAAWYGETDLDDATSSAVVVIRFTKSASGWKLAPSPHTLSAYSKDKVDEAGLLALIAEEESLAPFPEGSEVDFPPMPGADAGSDDRPDAEVRKELEDLWAALRSAFAAGDVAAAEPLLLMTDGKSLPSSEEAKGALAMLPDLSKSAFLKLGWRRDKPQLVGYYAETDLDVEDTSTVLLIVFVRHEGRYRFAPGPVSIEGVTVEKTDRNGLLDLIETDPRLQL
jgi:hypothetical protein